MTGISRRRIAGLVALLLCIAAGAARAQSTIALRTLARVEPGHAITLADVAELTGPDAQDLAGVVVFTPAEAAVNARVDLARVRSQIERNPKVNLGRLSFSGASCTIRTAISDAPAAPTAPALTPISQGETVRNRVEDRIAAAMGVPAADLRLAFEDHPDLLALSTAGRTIAIQPTATSDRMPISVRVYQGDRLLTQATIRVGIMVRRDVVIALAPLNRGGTPKADTLDTQEQWLPPSVIPAKMDQVVGSVVRGRVEAGKVVMAKDVEPPIVVQRGDIINIDCIAGTVVVSTTARAKEPGREGDVIQLQSLNSKKSFSARVNGPGRAILVSE